MNEQQRKARGNKMTTQTESLSQEEIISMARQAGFVVTHIGDPIGINYIMIEAFAKLLASAASAKEREACAKVCDKGVDTEHPTVKGCIMKNFGSSFVLAAAIRARGEA